MNKHIQRMLVIAFSLCFIVWVLDVSILTLAFDLEFYVKEFELNNTSVSTGFTIEELTTIFDRVLKYMGGNLESMQYNGVFTERELLHMVDVRNLFGFARKLSIGLALAMTSIFVVLVFKYEQISIRINRTFLISTMVIVLIMLSVFGLASTNFDRAFVVFHELFFNNDLWLLSSDSMLIKMLPQTLFAKMGLIIVGTFMVAMGITILISLLIERECEE